MHCRNKIEVGMKTNGERRTPLSIPPGGSGKLYGIVVVPESCPRSNFHLHKYISWYQFYQSNFAKNRINKTCKYSFSLKINSRNLIYRPTFFINVYDLIFICSRSNQRVPERQWKMQQGSAVSTGRPGRQDVCVRGRRERNLHRFPLSVLNPSSISYRKEVTQNLVSRSILADKEVSRHGAHRAKIISNH